MEQDKEIVENNDKVVEETSNVATHAENEEKIKTFTQDEVNAIIAKRLKEVPSKDEMQKYHEWQESQKTIEQKAEETKTLLEQTKTENKKLLNEIAILKANVAVNDADYVMFKVGQMKGDFNENLEQFLKDNPKYLNSNQQSTIVTSNATGTPVQKTTPSKTDGVLNILKEKYPSINF